MGANTNDWGSVMETVIKPVTGIDLAPPIRDQDPGSTLEKAGLTVEDETFCSICDLCGDATPADQIQNTSCNAQLCPSCYTYFLSIPEACRNCFQRILLGNVC
jgi:hypothetical protein